MNQIFWSQKLLVMRLGYVRVIRKQNDSQCTGSSFFFPRSNPCLKELILYCRRGKAKTTEALNIHTGNDPCHCFEQWQLRMYLCLNFEGYLKWFFKLCKSKELQHQSCYFCVGPHTYRIQMYNRTCKVVFIIFGYVKCNK
jgi:hypothetical protein